MRTFKANLENAKRNVEEQKRKVREEEEKVQRRNDTAMQLEKEYRGRKVEAHDQAFADLVRAEGIRREAKADLRRADSAIERAENNA